MTSFDVAILGSGFGGAVLARALARGGRRVVLLERGRHPRFALGESSTPLAALSLERLAATYRLPDLHRFAAYGRWRRHHPELPCGLKRGFTFLRHRADDTGPLPAVRVAASPNDAVADTHWLRADFDAFQVELAAAAGVLLLDRTSVDRVEVGVDGVEISCSKEGESRTVESAFVVDATGAARVLESSLDLPPGLPLRTRSHLVFSHFDSVGSDFPTTGTAPYPQLRAAVHHLIDEGWVYELRFDDGVVSAGALLREPPTDPPAESWRRIVTRYPALERNYGPARSLRPISARTDLQYRMTVAAGRRWAALPNTFAFVDPLFSTGIAWTLIAVERLADLLTVDRPPDGRALARYADLLWRESEQIDRLTAGAYELMRESFARFSVYSMAYFATVSWSEARQRLCDPPRPAWDGFLGVDDPRLRSLFEECRSQSTSHSSDDRYARWLLARIADRDIAGLDRYAASGEVPVDLELLIERADRLGLTADQIRPRLPGLRGEC